MESRVKGWGRQTTKEPLPPECEGVIPRKASQTQENEENEVKEMGRGDTADIARLG